jgi:hypothetical protein
MAGAEALRDMGETLVYLLRVGMAASGFTPAPDVKLATPDEFDGFDNPRTPVVSVFLYRVGVNPEMRNGPRRTLPGGKTTRPLLPLELGYLITPWANQASEEHWLAGLVVQTLYDHAELGPADLQGDSWAPGDSVQVILETLPTDEHYRIWDTTNLPYRLSLTYLARVVGIEPLEATGAAPVVEARIGRGP